MILQNHCDIPFCDITISRLLLWYQTIVFFIYITKSKMWYHKITMNLWYHTFEFVTSQNLQISFPHTKPLLFVQKQFWDGHFVTIINSIFYQKFIQNYRLCDITNTSRCSDITNKKFCFDKKIDFVTSKLFCDITKLLLLYIQMFWYHK